MGIKIFNLVKFQIFCRFLDLLEHNNEIVSPFIKGCETFQPKLINICLTALQRLITAQVLVEVCNLIGFHFCRLLLSLC